MTHTPGPAPQQLDEHGRDISVHLRSERSSRADAYQRRRAARHANASLTALHPRLPRHEGNDDGWSTDDEPDDVDHERRERQKADVVDKGRHVMDDVADAYKSIQKIRTRLERWKAEFPKVEARKGGREGGRERGSEGGGRQEGGTLGREH